MSGQKSAKQELKKRIQNLSDDEIEEMMNDNQIIRSDVLERMLSARYNNDNRGLDFELMALHEEEAETALDELDKIQSS